MKRLVSLLLCAALLAGLTVTAGAESGADDRLSQVTEAVKKTLDLDTEGYDDFQGDSYEDSLTRMWSLQWSGTGGSLTVEALEDGTIAGSATYMVLYLGKSFIEGLLLGSALGPVLLSVATKAVTSGVNAVIAVIVSVPLCAAIRLALKKSHLLEKLG